MSADELAILYTLIRELTAEVATLKVAIARVETQLSTRRECPSPGLCVTLTARVEALEKRAATNDGERAGVTMAGKILWAFIGSGGIAVVAGAYHMLTTH